MQWVTPRKLTNGCRHNELVYFSSPWNGSSRPCLARDVMGHVQFQKILLLDFKLLFRWLECKEGICNQGEGGFLLL
jgi:hypothetical protein